jgi:hypothetical protein
MRRKNLLGRNSDAGALAERTQAGRKISRAPGLQRPKTQVARWNEARPTATREEEQENEQKNRPAKAESGNGKFLSFRTKIVHALVFTARGTERERLRLGPSMSHTGPRTVSKSAVKFDAGYRFTNSSNFDEIQRNATKSARSEF